MCLFEIKSQCGHFSDMNHCPVLFLHSWYLTYFFSLSAKIFLFLYFLFKSFNICCWNFLDPPHPWPAWLSDVRCSGVVGIWNFWTPTYLLTSMTWWCMMFGGSLKLFWTPTHSLTNMIWWCKIFSGGWKSETFSDPSIYPLTNMNLWPTWSGNFLPKYWLCFILPHENFVKGLQTIN